MDILAFTIIILVLATPMKNTHSVWVAIKELCSRVFMMGMMCAKFSKYDNDIDKAHFTCDITSKCGWWYYVCGSINPKNTQVRCHYGQTRKNLSWLM